MCKDNAITTSRKSCGDKKAARILRGIGLKSLLSWKQQAQNVKLGSCPCDIDHTLADNPFISRFGNDWVKKCPGLKSFVSINDLIDHMFVEAKKLMNGYVHEADFFVYHDALSLMTGRGAVEYMSKKVTGID